MGAPSLQAHHRRVVARQTGGCPIFTGFYRLTGSLSALPCEILRDSIEFTVIIRNAGARNAHGSGTRFYTPTVSAKLAHP